MCMNENKGATSGCHKIQDIMCYNQADNCIVIRLNLKTLHLLGRQ